MEPRKESGPIDVTEPSIRDCGQTARGLHLEVMSSSESCDVNLPEPQPTRSLKWTALKFFGGRKSICSLPSFFRGRKCHGKGNSKKINKSKTHDGISKVSWEDGGRAGDMPTKDFEYHTQKDSALPSSKSSQVMNEFSEGGVSCLPTLSGDHKAFWDKSLPFRRPKRGLKGFFSSLRCPKKHRNVESGNREAFEMSGNISEHTMRPTESEIDNHDPKSVGHFVEPKAPASDVKDTLTITCEVNEEAFVSKNSIDCTDQDSLNSLTGAALEPASDALNIAIEGEALCSNVDLTHTPVARLELTDGREQFKSPDHMAVKSADEASLKSFDSLTGCGDVIADQDEDNIADRTVLGEKSRCAAKRSSSYVNYQGGGEEMATPDEVDSVDYLKGLWESDTVGKVGSFPGEHPCDISLAEAPLIPSSHMDAGGNCSSLQHVTGTSHAPILALTPQSDQQGSLPNSDEGYYDSTTPGPDEDRRDDIVGISSERLPRDSYSGDALYELYESEDPLTSPHLEGKHSIKTLSPTLDSLDFLCLTSQSPDEEHLPGQEYAQQGVQNSTAKEQTEFKFSFKNSSTECITRLNKKQACQNEEPQIISWTQSPKGERVSYESGCLNDRNKNGQIVSCFQKSKDNHLDDTKVEDVICTTAVPKSALPLRDLSSYAVQGQGMDLPENQGKTLPSNKVEVEAEHGKTVCYSQALVNFTNNARLFSNLSLSLVGPEPGSVFAQNMEALPAMVTFDVFDTENEGECDRHTEMETEIELEMEMEMEMEATDDDVESPYESSPYESYLQKDAFAEWDDKMLNDFDRSLFYSNAWGVASLPRYYGLAGISPPVPAALSAKRRSRSLDTDALESEISDLCLTKTKPMPVPIALPKSEQRSINTSPLHLKTNGHLANPEMQGRAETTLSWQPQTSGNPVPSLTDEKRIGWMQSALDGEGPKPAFLPQSQHISQGTKCKIRPQISKCAVQEKLGCNSTLQSPGQMVKSSHLPVQCGPHSFQPDPSMSGTPGEFLCRDPTQVSALDDRNRAHFSQKHFAKQLHKSIQPPSKIRPVGITRGMPHFRPDTNRNSNCKKQRECTSKGREDLSVSLPVGCHKHSV